MNKQRHSMVFGFYLWRSNAGKESAFQTSSWDQLEIVAVKRPETDGKNSY